MPANWAVATIAVAHAPIDRALAQRVVAELQQAHVPIAPASLDGDAAMRDVGARVRVVALLVTPDLMRVTTAGVRALLARPALTLLPVFVEGFGFAAGWRSALTHEQADLLRELKSHVGVDGVDIRTLCTRARALLPIATLMREVVAAVPAGGAGGGAAAGGGGPTTTATRVAELVAWMRQPWPFDVKRLTDADPSDVLLELLLDCEDGGQLAPFAGVLKESAAVQAFTAAVDAADAPLLIFVPDAHARADLLAILGGGLAAAQANNRRRSVRFLLTAPAVAGEAWWDAVVAAAPAQLADMLAHGAARLPPARALHGFDVFISHAGPQKESFAAPLWELLQSERITTFLDRAELAAGDTHTRMETALTTCRVAVVVLSTAFLDTTRSQWPLLELRRLLARPPQELAILPVVVLPGGDLRRRGDVDAGVDADIVSGTLPPGGAGIDPGAGAGQAALAALLALAAAAPAGGADAAAMRDALAELQQRAAGDSVRYRVFTGSQPLSCVFDHIVTALLAPPHGLGDMLDTMLLQLPGTYAPSVLLAPRYAVTNFRFRDVEVASLLAWQRADTGEDGLLLRLLHGGGGVGKTRLLVHVCQLLRGNGVDAGFLKRDVDVQRFAAALQATRHSLLIVVDYAESRPDLSALLQATAARHRARTVPGPPRRTHVVLLARSSGSWLADARGALGGALDGVPFQEQPLAAAAPTADQRRELFHAAINEFRPRLPPLAEAAVAAVLRPRAASVAAAAANAAPLEPPAVDNVLYLLAAALLAARGTWSGAFTLQQLRDAVLAHEAVHWLTQLEAVHQGRPDGIVASVTEVARLVAGYTLIGGADAERSAAIAAVLGSPDRPQLLQFLANCYPRTGGGVGPMEPDIIGEAQVAAYLVEPPPAHAVGRRAAHAAPAAARAPAGMASLLPLTLALRGRLSEAEGRHAFTLLGRTAIDVCGGIARVLSAVLDAVASPTVGLLWDRTLVMTPLNGSAGFRALLDILAATDMLYGAGADDAFMPALIRVVGQLPLDTPAWYAPSPEPNYVEQLVTTAAALPYVSAERQRITFAAQRVAVWLRGHRSEEGGGDAARRHAALELFIHDVLLPVANPTLTLAESAGVLVRKFSEEPPAAQLNRLLAGVPPLLSALATLHGFEALLRRMPREQLAAMLSQALRTDVAQYADLDVVRLAVLLLRVVRGNATEGLRGAAAAIVDIAMTEWEVFRPVLH